VPEADAKPASVELRTEDVVGMVTVDVPFSTVKYMPATSGPRLAS